ncbi:vesicle-fusing ATPase 1-like [Diaphorina citri]|uniref:Vesicle-fusing ATPase n=1 Tax=Diaphorina citri TaxID=121845 RepID=A0A1S3D0E2_DIACI|nr:vesicle-fusing ATPase 1-like [Diaphorina citri]
MTLQALRVLLKKEPPRNKKLLVLCTTSCREVLEDLKILSKFSAVLHVPNLSTPEHLLNVIEESDVFSKKQVQEIERYLHQHKARVFVGIRKLLGLIDMARQIEENYRVMKFLTKLEDEGCLDMGTSILH